MTDHVIVSTYDRAVISLTGYIDDNGDFVSNSDEWRVDSIEGDNDLWCKTCGLLVWPGDGVHNLSDDWVSK